MNYRVQASITADIIAELRALSIEYTELQFAYAIFWSKTREEFLAILTAIPPHVTSLDLFDSLSKKTGEELASIFNAIPPHVTSLHLRGNGLGFRKVSDLERAFKAVHKNLTSLDLGRNNFNDNDGLRSLKVIFEAITPHVTSLDLSENDLAKMLFNRIYGVLPIIPISVTSLNLSYNDFHYISADKLEGLLAKIPFSVTNLQMDEVFLRNWFELLWALPQSILTLTVRGHTASPAEQLLELIFPSKFRNKFFANPLLTDEKIQPCFKIDEQILRKLIIYLQKKPTSMSALVCALLLHGHIVTLCDESKLGDEHYVGKRSRRALSFYRRAACDKTLKPWIETILWIERITNQSLIGERLKKYQLSPSKYIPSCLFFKENVEPNNLRDIATKSTKEIDVSFL